MLVSMIIPVYNVEKYIRKCLDSVEKQTYQNLEVIIINDGSPDQSQLIIDEFCERNQNFQCFITENHGLGGARNIGMSKANGEYICFLDSDDYVKPEFVEKLVERAQIDQSDIVVCNNIDYYENQNREEISKQTYRHNPISLLEDKKILFNRVCAWGKLYRKELFDGLSYVSREWYEDMRLTPKLYARASKISYVDEPLLYYVIRDGSIMTSANAGRNLEIIDAFEDLHSYFIKVGLYEELKDELEFLMLDHVLVSAITRVLLTKDTKKKEIIAQLQQYLETYDHLDENPYIKTMPRNRKIIYECNRHHLYGLTKFIFKSKGLLERH